MEAEKSVFDDLVKCANEVFGITRWSHEVVQQQIDFIEKEGTSYRAGCNTIVRVVLDSGRFHQECGYCDTLAQSRGLALYRARSSSCTNAFKKALLSFGEIVPALMRNIQKSQTTDKSCAARKRKAQEMQAYWNERREKTRKGNQEIEASTSIKTADILVEKEFLRAFETNS